MLNTPTETVFAEDRRREALAWAAHIWVTATPSPPGPSSMARPVGRIRAGLRHVVAVLVAFAALVVVSVIG